MTFFIDTLRNYLWHRFSIAPETVQLDTRFRDDLSLTDSDINAIVEHLTDTAEITCPVDTVHRLTDVVDLMAYVLLRSMEENSRTDCFGEPRWPIAGLPVNESLLSRAIAHPYSNLNEEYAAVPSTFYGLTPPFASGVRNDD